ncbi:unnamed protein product [Orchesella dallaii]|uniref:Uncharacterized protein n=1 Tax=Orchesella dallaii TaxID=48710 RepID=A0ABP1RJX2_9HEXA
MDARIQLRLSPYTGVNFRSFRDIFMGNNADAEVITGKVAFTAPDLVQSWELRLQKYQDKYSMALEELEKLKEVNAKQAEALQDKDEDVEELESVAKKIFSSNVYRGSEASPANQQAEEPIASTSAQAVVREGEGTSS